MTTNGSTATTKPTKMSTTFHPFPLLPTELRLEIWDLCLPPTRLIPMSLLAMAHHHHVPGQPTPTAYPLAVLRAKLAQPTPIAAVCREARRAAHALRKPLRTLGLPWLEPVAEGQGDRVFFDPRIDLVMVDCDVVWHYAAAWRELSAALGIGRQGGVGVAVRSQAVEFPKPVDKEDMPEAVVGKGLGPVLMGDVVLKLTNAEAAEGGSFGMFGEGRVAVFDLSSAADRRRLDGLMRFHNSMVSVGYYMSDVEKELESFEDLREKFRLLGGELGLGTGVKHSESNPHDRPYPAFVVRRDY